MSATKRLLAAITTIGIATAAFSQDVKKAPDFSAPDHNGTSHSLSQYNGKIVVLELTNVGFPVSEQPGCPYMIPRYANKSMQNLAQQVEDAGGVYLAVNSASTNTPEDSKATVEEYGITYPILQDNSGAVGKAYEAKTTPHMIVIGKDGSIVYDGALNDNPTPDVSKDPAATKYVELALAAAQNGTMPEQTKTKPYGCGIKYAP